MLLYCGGEREREREWTGDDDYCLYFKFEQIIHFFYIFKLCETAV